MRKTASELHGEQLVLELDWGREPWEGVSPRHLARGSCGVDNFDVKSESGDANGSDVDPAQFTLFLEGKSL